MLLTALVLPALVLVAWAVRSPALLFVELNWDEALYWLIAGALAEGDAPYLRYWDRKPPGLFLLLAGVRAAFGDGVVVLRMWTATSVGISAFLLACIARMVLPQAPWAGPVAGLLLIAASMRGAGAGSNAELLLAPFALAGLALCLHARATGRAGTAAAAGLAFGFALQIKQVAAFDALAGGVLMSLLPLAEGVAFRRCLRLAAALSLGVLAPLLAGGLWYAAIGALPAYVVASLQAGAAAAGAGPVAFDLEAMRAGLRDLAPLLAGGAAALALPLVVPGGASRDAARTVAIWFVAVVAALLLLRRFADHMWLQLLPPAALGSAAVLAGAIERWRPARPWRLATVAAVVALALLWGAGRAGLAGLETLSQRASGQPHWGDRTATVAAGIGGRIAQPTDLYVAGRLLGLYHATGTIPPTRFPFTLHLWAPYAPVDGVAEMARIMAGRPRFVVVDDLWLDGRLPNGAAPVFAVLRAALGEHYVIDGRVGRFASRGGGFVGGGIGATVFRRRDVAAGARTDLPTYRPP